jgi:hypothetical protein
MVYKDRCCERGHVVDELRLPCPHPACSPSETYIVPQSSPHTDELVKPGQHLIRAQVGGNRYIWNIAKLGESP